MSTPNTTIRRVQLDKKGGANAQVRVWDIPYTVPVHELSITVSSQGAVLPAGGIDWEVFYGGQWSNGQPFAVGSTLSGGVSQASGTFGAGEVAHIIHSESDIIPPNSRLTPSPADAGPVRGIPISVDLDCQIVARGALLIVSFVSRFLGDYA